MIALQDRNKIRGELEKIDKKIETVEAELRIMNNHLVMLADKLIDKIDKKTIEQNQELEDIKTKIQQWNGLESEFKTMANKITNLENNYQEEASKTDLETIMVLPISLVKIVKRRIEMQERILEDKKLEINKRDARWKEVQVGLETMKEDYKMLKFELKRIKEEKELLNKELKQTTV